MMLSEVLRRFFVLPFGQWELARFSVEDDPKHGQIIALTWTDDCTGLYRRRTFVDQDVGQDFTHGVFEATTTEGYNETFFALDNADLTKCA